MKRFLQFIWVFVFVISLCVCTVEASTSSNESIGLLRASDYFDVYIIDATSGAAGEVVVNFRIYATGAMSTIGVKKIVIQEKVGTRWQEVHTKQGTAYNGLLDKKTDEFSGSYTYNGESGKTYRAIVTIYAEDSLGNEVPSRFMRKIVCRLRQT